MQGYWIDSQSPASHSTPTSSYPGRFLLLLLRNETFALAIALRLTGPRVLGLVEGLREDSGAEQSGTCWLGGLGGLNRLRSARGVGRLCACLGGSRHVGS